MIKFGNFYIEKEGAIRHIKGELRQVESIRVFRSVLTTLY